MASWGKCVRDGELGERLNSVCESYESCEIELGSTRCGRAVRAVRDG